MLHRGGVGIHLCSESRFDDSFSISISLTDDTRAWTHTPSPDAISNSSGMEAMTSENGELFLAQDAIEGEKGWRPKTDWDI